MMELEKILARMEVAVKEKQKVKLEVQHNNPVVAVKEIAAEPSQQGVSIASEPLKPTISEDAKAGMQLCSLVAQCFDSLNVYGKTTDQLENIAGAFQLVLGDYDIDTVSKAFAKHLRRSSTMPTPADIVNIIDPPPQKLSGAVYISLKKQLIDNIFTTDEERAYIAAYERQEMDKLRGGSQELHDAQEEVKRYQKSLMIGCED